MTAPAQPKPAGALASLAPAMRSWRTASVALLSFSSGMPLGLVWYAIPDWMRSIGVDIRVVGLFTLAQAPWAFKVLWSPLMDRYVPPFWGGGAAGWPSTQVALARLGARARGRRRPSRRPLGGRRARARHRLRLRVAGHRHRRLRGGRAAPGRAGRGRRRAHRALPRGAWSSRAARPSPPPGCFGWPAVNVFLAPALPADAARHRGRRPSPRSRRRRRARLREAVWHPFLGFLAPPPGARDPRLRPALQVRRPAHAGADAAVPDRHGLQRRPPRHRARHRRPGRHHRRRLRRRRGSPRSSGSGTRSGSSASCRSSRTSATTCVARPAAPTCR